MALVRFRHNFPFGHVRPRIIGFEIGEAIVEKQKTTVHKERRWRSALNFQSLPNLTEVAKEGVARRFPFLSKEFYDFFPLAGIRAVAESASTLQTFLSFTVAGQRRISTGFPGQRGAQYLILGKDLLDYKLEICKSQGLGRFITPVS